MSAFDLREPLIHPLEPLIHLVEPLVDPVEAHLERSGLCREHPGDAAEHRRGEGDEGDDDADHIRVHEHAPSLRRPSDAVMGSTI